MIQKQTYLAQILKFVFPGWRQCDQKKSPNVDKSCPKMISLGKLLKNVGDLGKRMLPKALKSGPKSNKSPDLVTLVGDENFKALIFKLCIFSFEQGGTISISSF